VLPRTNSIGAAEGLIYYVVQTDTGQVTVTPAEFPGNCIIFVRSMSNCAQPLCLAGQEDKP
jgi:hypothetical protein